MIRTVSSRTSRGNVHTRSPKSIAVLALLAHVGCSTPIAVAEPSTVSARSSASAQDVGCGETLELEIAASDVGLDGARFHLRAETDGSVFVWPRGTDLDLVLRVEGENGEVLATDDDSGGARIPFLRLDLRDGALVTIVVSAKGPHPSERFDLCVRCAPESEATQSAAAALGERVEAARSARTAGDRELAVETLRTALDEALATEGSRSSWSVSLGAWALATELRILGEDAAARTANAVVRELRSEMLPETHVDRLRADATEAPNPIDVPSARAAVLIQRRVEATATRALAADDPHLQTIRLNFAHSLTVAGEPHEAARLLRSVLEVRLAALSPDDPAILRARINLGAALSASGDVAHAAEQFAAVVESGARSGNATSPEVLLARSNWAACLYSLDRIDEAIREQEIILETLVGSGRVETDSDLIQARDNLALSLGERGELESARDLYEANLAAMTAHFPAHDYSRHRTQAALGGLLIRLGDVERAVALLEESCAVLGAVLPAHDPASLSAHANWAYALALSGDSGGARDVANALLAALEPDSGSPTESYGLFALSSALYHTGDFVRARGVADRLYRARSLALQPDSTRLQEARELLARCLHALGDATGARALLEAAIAARLRAPTRDEDGLASARGMLGTLLADRGEFVAAREEFRARFEHYERSRPLGDRDRSIAETTLARVDLLLGEHASARERMTRIVATLEETHGPHYPPLFSARGVLAGALDASGEFEAAHDVALSALEGERATTGRDGRGAIAQLNELAQISAHQGDVAGCTSLTAELARIDAGLIDAMVLASAPREIEERVDAMRDDLAWVLSLAHGRILGGVPREIAELGFLLGESMRSATARAATLQARAASGPGTRDLFENVQRAARAVARRSRIEDPETDSFLARQELDRASSELVRSLSSAPAQARLVSTPSIAELAQSLRPDSAVVSYLTYDKLAWEPNTRTRTVTPTWLASVLRSDGILTTIDLGPSVAVDALVDRWRGDLIAGAMRDGRGVGAVGDAQPGNEFESGSALRRAILDPLRTALAGARTLAFVPDDALCAVPFDALPDGTLRLGDSVRVEMRRTTFELAWPARLATDSTALVALGAADYTSTEPVSPTEVASVRSLLRGGAFEESFSPLPDTRAEVLGIAQAFRASSAGSGETFVLLDADATVAKLAEHAARARWLHVAGHAWIAPAMGANVSTANGRWRAPTFESSTAISAGARLSPMTLCGLALGGANLAADASGAHPGLVTAEECATWRLANCELAVLSACETGVGVARAGQGLASLQKALAAAGARSVITSLWKVPDAATSTLMREFYRRLWVLRQPKAVALWEAKRTLREARASNGLAEYSTRDWAGWVLTGSAD